MKKLDSYIKSFAKNAINIWPANCHRKAPSRTPIHWVREQQLALEELVEHLSNPPVMAYPDFSKAFTLHNDASKDGFEAVMYQKQDGVMRVIAYASRALSPTERNTTFMKENLSFWPWNV